MSGLGASAQVAINTTGFAAMAGVASTLIGILLLIIATLQAIVGQVRSPGREARQGRGLDERRRVFDQEVRQCCREC